MATPILAQPHPPQKHFLDPRGQIHIPIGLPNTPDSLKTFVEAEGSFSPGFATYGIYFWLWDGQKLHAPTMDGVKCEHGLFPEGYLIPFSKWKANSITVRSAICQTQRQTPQGPLQLLAAYVDLTNTSNNPNSSPKVSLYVALRPLGPAGGPVNSISLSDDLSAILVNSHPALISTWKPSAAGVTESDTIADFALANKLPPTTSATSPTGNCSAALRFDTTLFPFKPVAISFICPILPGRRAVSHKWDAKNPWAQLDDANPISADSGPLQPDPPLSFYKSLNPDDLFKDAQAYWKDLVGRVSLSLPDPRWAEAFSAITSHLMLCMNDNAPDVAVVNYNVFNRDGMYAANAFQKAGRPDLSAAAIDYFLSHPFNGRIHPEADNPGQILWIIGQHYLFTRDKPWLERVYPSLKKLANMVRYYRTTPGPHWVQLDSLDFGPNLLPDKRKELKPGSCDGHHPEYTEAYDIAGLRCAATLARDLNNDSDAANWSTLADTLFTQYQQKFEKSLPKSYGSYSVLWPCHLYPYDQGPAHDQFKNIGPQKPTDWRYFPLASAHQGLLAGNRAAGHSTLSIHLDHPQMQGFFAFDEGGPSGSGAWRFARTTWPVFPQGDKNPQGASIAMPHGWAVAELVLLLRDCLVYEDNDTLVLLAGIPDEWFTSKQPLIIQNLPTHFGTLSLKYQSTDRGATLTLAGSAKPPGGCILRLPGGLKGVWRVPGGGAAGGLRGSVGVPAGVRNLTLEWQ